MMRRRNVGLVVAISVIATVLATVAVTFAVQTIFGSKTVGARATVVTIGGNLRVCDTSDTTCPQTLTGDLDFGNVVAGGVSHSVDFFIKNTEEIAAGPIFVDVRIKSGDQFTLLNTGDITCGFGTCIVLSGDAPNLGVFEVRRNDTTSLSFSFPKDPRLGLAGQDVIPIRVIWTPAVGLREGPVTFQILVDVVE